ESQPLEHGENTIFLSRSEHADLHRVAAVQRDTDGHRLSVPQLMRSERLELVRRPVAVIQWPRTPSLKRVSTMGDLTHVQLRTAADHARHGVRGAGVQSVGLALQPFEENALADQGDFDGFGNAGDAVAWMQRTQEARVVKHGKGRGEAADEVLDAEGVHAVL